VKAQPTPTIDDSLLAVAERATGHWRVLLVRRGDKPTVVDAKSLPTADDSALAHWLQEQRCGDLRMVLPAHATIVRSMTIPVASPGQMLAALRLQAEGMFLGSVPPVRIGLGVLEGASESERQGIVMAWPDSQSGAGLHAKLENITRYVPEPAAMLVLASGSRPAISADRSVGSVAIAMRSQKGGLEIRATRESAASDIDGDRAWSEGLRRALVETALNAGMEPSRVAAWVDEVEASAERSGDRVLMLDPDVASLLGERLEVRVSASDEPDWWRQWAILLSAAIVATGPLGELAKMRRLEERAAPSRVERFVERYSNPSRAALVACIAFGIVGVAPIAAAWMRMKTLEWKMPEAPSAFEASQRRVEQRIALYNELSKRTLPVAKILGDLACCTPDGVEIEQIQVSSTQGVTVRGVAKAQGERSAAEIVNTMARLMDSSGIFDKTHWRWNMPDGRGIFKFDLDALVVRPTKAGEFKDHDWAVKSLVQVKYPQADGAAGSDAVEAAGGTAPVADAGSTTPPEGALAEGPRRGNGSRPASTDAAPSPDATAAKPDAVKPEGTDAASTSTPARGIGRRDPATTPSPAVPAGSGDPSTAPATAASGAGAGGGPAATARANTRVPDPFTDEELAAMSKETARGLLSEVSRARRREDLDADTRKRLSDDFNRILERLKK